MEDVAVARIKPAVRRGLTVVELDGEAVIYDEETSDVHHLNPTATIVFRLCDGSATIADISTDISQAFGVPEDQIEAQVRTLVRQFRKAKLLTANAPGGSRNGPAHA